MKRVVLLKSAVSGFGGLEKYASRIARAFLDRGDRVTLLSTGKPSPSCPFEVVSTPTVPWPAFWRMEQYDRFVRTYLKSHPADIVFGMDRNRVQTHYRAGNGVHAAYLESRRLSEGALKHLVCTLNPLHLKILELEKAAFEYPGLQTLIVNSYMVRGQVLTHYETDPSKIEVIHNGVEWHEMASDFEAWPKARSEVARSLGLDPSLFHFLFIGHGYRRKGLRELLRALSLLPMRDFHLSVVGKEKHLSEFQALTHQLGLHRHVTFFGPQKNIRPFYQLADSLVIPSFYDPFANVTIEALAMGLFVVSSKSNGGSEILTRESGAVIEELLDPASFAQALQVALQNRKTEESARSIRNGVERFDFSHVLNRLVETCRG